MSQTITQIPASRLHVDGNVRKDVDPTELAELTASIAANGILEPLRVVANNDGYRIESGQRRWLAALAGAAKGDDPDLPCIVVTPEDAADELVKGLVTNIQRASINPVDEATAYMTLLSAGLTPEGVAARVGVAKRRVTERLELLDFQSEVVELFRTGALPPSVRKNLLAIQRVSIELCRDVAKACAGKAEWAAVLASEPGRVVGHVAADKPKKYFRTHQRVLDRPGYSSSQDPTYAAPPTKVTKELATKLPKGSYVYLHLEADDLDGARAAGVLYEGKGSDHGVITDLEWLADWTEVALARYLKVVEQRAVEAARQKVRQGEAVAEGKSGESAAAQAEEELKEFRRAVNEARRAGKASAHAHNQDLGAKLLTQLASVDVGPNLSVDAARALAFGMLGTKIGELFQSGLRYCLPQYVVEEKSKDGKRTKITFKGVTKKEAAELAIEFLAGAKKPGEVVGRAVCLLAAARWADEGVLPTSSQGVGWGSACPSSWFGMTYDIAGRDQVDARKAIETFLNKEVKALVPAPLRAAIKPSAKPVEAVLKAEPELAAKAGFRRD